MRLNALGYTTEYSQQCAAWTVNSSGPARKQCGMAVTRNIGGWVYLCNRHYELIEREIEREMDSLNAVRVVNMQARLDAVSHIEARERDASQDIADMMAEADQRRSVQTVYFIRCEEYVKIGISKNVTARLHQIRKGGGSLFPRLLDVETSELIATEPGGLNRERELHQRFAHLRHTGEWFTEAPELTEYIDGLDIAA